MAVTKHETPAGGPAAYIDHKSRKHRQRPSNILTLLGGLSCLGILLSIGLIFFYTPVDALQGEVQRILYFHVPAAWVGMLSFIVLAVVSIIYLIKPDERLDWTARAAAEVGTVFLTIAILLGAIWGRPVWGTWWSWDPKLTASFILWFMFVGYILLRGYMGRGSESMRAGAVWSIVGVFDVPIIYLSVTWWRGLHPTQMVGTSDGLPAQATLTLRISILAFTLLYVVLMALAYQLQRLQEQAQKLRLTLE